MSISNYDQDDQKNLKQNEPEMVPPDGGWGWFIIIGGFFSMVFSFFPVLGFSILYSPLFNSGISSFKIAWSFSLYGFIWNIFTLFIGPLNEEFGWRKVAIAGGICNSMSVMAAVFITNPDVLIFTSSVFGGIGGAIGITISYIVVSRYFLSRRGFALAATSLGMCLSTFVSPLVANYLLEFYGFRGACLIYAALVLNQCVGGSLFQPIQWHLKPSFPSSSGSKYNESNKRPLLNSTKQEDFQIHVSGKDYSQNLPSGNTFGLLLQEEENPSEFSPRSVNSNEKYGMYSEATKIESQNQTTITRNKNTKNVYNVVKKIIILTHENILILKFMRVKIICIGFACFSFGNLLFQGWVPFAIRDAGFSLEMSAWCVSISSIANLSGRILISFISDRRWFNVTFVYMLSTFSIAFFISVFSFVSDMNLYLLCLSCWGFGVGVAHSVTPIVFIYSVGVEIFPSVLGVANLTFGVTQIAFMPVIGIIRDVTSSYTYAMFFIGVLVLFGFVAWLFMPLAIKNNSRRYI